MQRAEAAASKALQIDVDLAAAQTSIGAVESVCHWNWSAGERAFRRAIELDPSYPLAHLWYAACILAPLGRLDEAYAEWNRAAELDPVTPIANVGPGFILFLQRQYDRAIEELRRTLELDPSFSWSHFFLGLSHLAKGDHGEAIAALHRGSLPQQREGVLGYVYAVSGEPEKARKLIEELQAGSRPPHLAPYLQGVIYLGLGDNDKAFECLDKACKQRSPQLYWLKVFPLFDSVRADPRFQDILCRMNLAD
jgi:serine/threonine-protein kinase